jgi:hypothetical protein
MHKLEAGLALIISVPGDRFGLPTRLRRDCELI